MEGDEWRRIEIDGRKKREGENGVETGTYYQLYLKISLDQL